MPFTMSCTPLFAMYWAYLSASSSLFNCFFCYEMACWCNWWYVSSFSRGLSILDLLQICGENAGARRVLLSELLPFPNMWLDMSSACEALLPPLPLAEKSRVLVDSAQYSLLGARDDAFSLPYG